jgi:hypothetical protein
VLATNNSGTPTDARLTTLTVSKLSVKAWEASFRRLACRTPAAPKRVEGRYPFRYPVNASIAFDT